MKKPVPIDDLSASEAKRKHARLAREIAQHDIAYHQNDAPTISDADYDALRRDLEKLEARFPELTETTEVSKSVGAAPSEKFAKVRHVVPMLSLGNIFEDEEAAEFIARVRRFLGLAADAPLPFTAEPKSTANWCRRRRAAMVTKARMSPLMCAPSPKFRMC